MRSLSSDEMPFVAKTDDDSFLHLPRLIQSLALVHCMPHVYFGAFAFTGYNPSSFTGCGFSWLGYAACTPRDPTMHLHDALARCTCTLLYTCAMRAAAHSTPELAHRRHIITLAPGYLPVHPWLVYTFAPVTSPMVCVFAPVPRLWYVYLHL